MQTLGMNGYTDAEVIAQLVGASRYWSFRYELLSKTNVKVGDLTNVAAGSVEYNALADVKGQAKFTLEDNGDVDYLQDRIKPWVRLAMPPKPGAAYPWVEWPQGVYLLATPTRQTTATGRVMREVEGYDQGLVLRDDLVASRYYVAAGTRYTDAVVAVVDGLVPSVDVVPSALELPSDKEWEPGTSRAAIAGELLSAANYAPLTFDARGVGQVRPYQSPQDVAPAYPYANDALSVMLPGVSQERDLYGVANRWVLVASEPESPPLTAERVNAEPSSPTSTVSRGRTITDFRKAEGDAPDQATLDARVERLAFEASQVYEAVEFETGLMPFHEHAEVYSVTFSDLGLSAKFSEHRWSFPLKTGATMKHRARRVVSV